MKISFLLATIGLLLLGQGETLAADSKQAKTLIIGGGSSHDFSRWFNMEDVATLRTIKGNEVVYTEKADEALEKLPNIDVLYLCHNWPMTNSALQKAIFTHADAGKGIILVHPALWYNWQKYWPEYNRVLVGGGTRSHDKYGKFQVNVVKTDHPVMQNVPATISVTDELYRFEPDASGTPIEVLATATEPSSGKTYSNIWVTKHPKARIVCITLGHDGMTHSDPAYKTLLINSWNWVSKK